MDEKTASTSRKIRVLIVDDEPLARRTLRSLLRQDPEVEISGECSDGLEAVKAIRAGAQEIVFLDVQMPGMNGFEVLEAAGMSHISAVVFVTAYDQYAIQAFEVNAVDYLLKPFDDERFRIALGRAKDLIRRRGESAFNRRIAAVLRDLGVEARAEADIPGERKAGYLQRIAVKSAGRVIFLKVEEINWIEAAAQYVELHADAKTYLVRESIYRLESRLDPARFFRVHRSALVNLDRVREVRRDDLGGSNIVLRNGTQIRISRGRREKLEQILTSGR